METVLTLSGFGAWSALGASNALPAKRRRASSRPESQAAPCVSYRSYGAWFDAYHRTREAIEARALAEHPEDSVARMAQVKSTLEAWTRANAGSDTSRWTDQERAVHEVTSNPATWAL